MMSSRALLCFALPRRARAWTHPHGNGNQYTDKKKKRNKPSLAQAAIVLHLTCRRKLWALTHALFQIGADKLSVCREVCPEQIDEARACQVC